MSSTIKSEHDDVRFERHLLKTHLQQQQQQQQKGFFSSLGSGRKLYIKPCIGKKHVTEDCKSLKY